MQLDKKNFEYFNGKEVSILLTHKVYGAQKATGILNLFQDADKIGFVHNGHQVFLYHNEIEFFECNAKELKLVGQPLSIKIAII